MESLTNYCIKGQCSNCGSCCTELIPLTNDEVKLIRAYVKEKNIKQYSKIFFEHEGKISVNLMCPFRDFENKKCRIYEVRPKICRLFKCNQDINTINAHKNNCHRRAQYNKSKSYKEPITKVYSSRELIYGDKLDTIRILIGNLIRTDKPIFTEGVIEILKVFKREDLAVKEDIDKVIEEYKYFEKVSKEN